MRRYELTDEQFELIADLMPSNGHRGRQWNDHRQTLNGMFWILHTGAQWREMSERYGKWRSVYDRFNRWRKDGTFDRILERLQYQLDEDGRIDWDLWCVDGSSIRASRSAAGAGSKTRRENHPTTHWVAREAGGAASSTWLLTVEAFPSPRKSHQGKPTTHDGSSR
jgi:transposase